MNTPKKYKTNEQRSCAADRTRKGRKGKPNYAKEIHNEVAVAGLVYDARKPNHAARAVDMKSIFEAAFKAKSHEDES